ncbi:MAG TPA: diphthine--ammonia ligase [Chitinophagales bacterium]|nr:diphthine--ammonia ligase [Chitinophagales bacterium]
MEGNKRAVFNWSGGKDSSLALHRVLQQGEYDIDCLLTTASIQQKRINMHGVRLELMQKQAEAIGLPLMPVMLNDMPAMEEYNRVMGDTMKALSGKGITYSIFGDIFLEDLKDYRDGQLTKVNMKGVYPIWKEDSLQLLKQFIEQGFKAVLVCVNERYLDKSFAGRLLDESFLNDLPDGVDPCGENGEFHSFVFDGPIFKQPVAYKTGEVVYRKYELSGSSESVDTGFFYCDLLPA